MIETILVTIIDVSLITASLCVVAQPIVEWMINRRYDAEQAERYRLEAEWQRRRDVRRTALMGATPRLDGEHEGDWLRRVNAQFWSTYTRLI